MATYKIYYKKAGKAREVLGEFRNVENPPLGYFYGFKDGLAYAKNLHYPCVMSLDGHQCWTENRDHDKLEHWWLGDEEGNII